jgi:hypothetical protein
MKKEDFENSESAGQEELEKITKILLREIKEREYPANKNELKKIIKNRVLGSEEDEN